MLAPRWRRGHDGRVDFSLGTSGRVRPPDQVMSVGTRSGRTHARALPRDRMPAHPAERHARTSRSPVSAGALDRRADRQRRGVKPGEQGPEPFQ